MERRPLSDRISNFEQNVITLLSQRQAVDRVVRLAGDASNRAFFRVFYTTGATAVVMAYLDAQPEGEETFLEVQQFLHGLELPVPKVLACYPQERMIVLEDLGDDLLETLVERSDQDRITELYELAVDLLFEMRRATETRDSGCGAFTLAFDEEKLMQEMNFFMTNFVRGLCGRSMSPAASATLDAFFTKICSMLASEPRIFTHRDYHSRNLILHQGRLVMIDFQDARMGPAQYDLASLLRDSYVTLPEELADTLVDRYAEETGQTSQDLKDRFRYVFDVMSLQRNIKALGTFGYQVHVRDARRYLESIPRTGAYVARNIAKYEEFALFRAVVEDLICYPASRFA